MVCSKYSNIPNMRKGVVTHSTIDNNDGREDTMTGFGTTHDTNSTLFQLPTVKERTTIPTILEENDSIDFNLQETDNFAKEILPYNIGKRIGPPLFTNIDNNPSDLLNHCLEVDLIWSICGSFQSIFENEEFVKIGSWTGYQKLISQYKTLPCIQEYLPVVSSPPEYPVCKEYLDFLIDLLRQLEIPYIFAHADEMVYAKLCHILWKHKDIYENIIVLMGGFHQLRVKQRLLFKRYSFRGMKQWCVDAETIADGSADQAFEGRHYYRCMRIHKECFDALVQMRTEQITSEFNFFCYAKTDVGFDKIKIS